MKRPKGKEVPFCCGAHRGAGKVKDMRRGIDRQKIKRVVKKDVEDQEMKDE